jgi:hypothetical protein
MRAFIVGVLAALVIAAAAALLLDDLVQRSATTAFSTDAARVSDG